MERMMQLLYGNSASSSASSAINSTNSATPEAEDKQHQSSASRSDSTTATTARDAESHRQIEKRRRDRMKSALSELCCLVPSAREKQCLGRVEKAEIIELASQHIIALTNLVGQCKTESAAGHQNPAAVSAENYQHGFLDCTRVTLSYLTQSLLGPSCNTDELCSHLYAQLQSALQSRVPSDPDGGFDTGNCMEAQPDIATLTDSREVQLHRMLPSVEFGNRHMQQASQSSQPTPTIAVATTEDGPPEAAEDDARSIGDVSGDLHLPGFILHPSGTHYLPMVLPRLAFGTRDSQGKPACREDAEELLSSPDVLHPISIPVDFGSPTLVRLPPPPGGRKRRRRLSADADSDRDLG